MDKIPKISIIIPTLNEAERIKLLLDFLSFYEDTEIIVSDGGSTDGTVQIVSRYPNVMQVFSPKGRGNQMNTGAASATSDILFFLHADTLPPEDFISKITSAFADPKVRAGSFYLKFDREHPLLRFYSWLSRINTRLATYGDQAFFIRRKVFEQIGGFAAIPLMEDLEIQPRLRKGGKFIKLDVPVTTSARKFSEKGFLWNEIRNVILVILYLLGIPAEKLAHYY